MERKRKGAREKEINRERERGKQVQKGSRG